MATIAKTLDSNSRVITIMVSAALRGRGGVKHKSKNVSAQVLVTPKQLKWILSQLRHTRDNFIHSIPLER